MNKKKIGIIGLDGIICILSMIGTVWEIAENGWGMLWFYTVDSNIFLTVVCVVECIALCCNWNKKAMERVYRLKYLATCCITITFIVVTFLLGPSQGGIVGIWKLWTKGALLFHHLLCPVLMIISYCLNCEIRKKWILVSLLVTGTYAIVTTVANIVKLIHGPYAFLYVYEQPVWMSVLWAMVTFVIAFLVGAVLSKVHQLLEKKQAKCYNEKTYVRCKDQI